MLPIGDFHTVNEIEYVAEHNEGHDLYYLSASPPIEGYLQEVLDDRLLMLSAGPLATDEVFEIFFDKIDWDLLIYWQEEYEGPPVRVAFTLNPGAPVLELPNGPERRRLM